MSCNRSPVCSRGGGKVSGRIKKNRAAIRYAARDPYIRQYFSPAAYGTEKTVVPAITQYCRGKVIDLGCGDMPYKDLVLKCAEGYDTLDIVPHTPEIMFVGDIQHMDFLEDASYDCALCLEVLEHVPDPFRAAGEIRRILKDGGVLILSVPHLSRLHDEPHDYFRFTRHGIETILNGAGFAVLEIDRRGGLFSFLGHQVSTLLLCLCWHLSWIRKAVFFLNAWCCVRICHWLDRVLDQSAFPLGYTCVAKKMAGVGFERAEMPSGSQRDDRL